MREFASKEVPHDSGNAQISVKTETLVVETSRAPSFVDITDDMHRFLREIEMRAGFLVVFSRHTTAAIKINENEPLLLHDMEAFLEKIAPREGYYAHNDFSVREVNLEEEESPNGHAHCQHLIMGSSETIPVINGELALGRWQRLFLVELDRPRSREVLVQAWVAN